jgi:hypothetical protein
MNCKICDDYVENVDSAAVKVTCSSCVNDIISKMTPTIDRFVTDHGSELIDSMVLEDA